MKRLTYGRPLWFLALLIGALSFASCRQKSQPSSIALVAPSPTPLSTQFERTGITDMFMEDYRRPSDDAIVRFHCSDRASEAEALSLVRGSSTARFVERTDVFDS